MDLHPYDGKKRRFRHDDAGDQAFARGEVERLLRMPIGAHCLRYDLAFYSGGIGIVDDLFISIEAADAWRAKVADGFLLAEDALEGDIRWLIMADDDLTPDAALTTFIADHRAPFQAPTREEMWIERGSDVNSWTVAYTCQGWLHWMSHDEG